MRPETGKTSHQKRINQRGGVMREEGGTFSRAGYSLGREELESPTLTVKPGEQEEMVHLKDTDQNKSFCS